MVMVSHYGGRMGATPAPSAAASAPPAVHPAPGPVEASSRVSIKLIVTPPNARLVFDGKPAVSPVVLEQGAARKRLEVSAEGYETAVREVGPETATVLEIKLKRLAQ